MKAKSYISVDTAKTGQGIFAERLFDRGENLFTLAGEAFSFDELTTIHPVDHGSAIQIDKDSYIFPSQSCPALYINHSCVPNVGFKNQYEVVAIERIFPGDEIRFDYSTTMSEAFWELECHCGEKECRGIVRDFHHIPLELQRRYLELGIVQSFIVEEVELLQTLTDRGRLNREMMIQALNKGSADRESPLAASTHSGEVRGAIADKANDDD